MNLALRSFPPLDVATLAPASPTLGCFLADGSKRCRLNRRQAAERWKVVVACRSVPEERQPLKRSGKKLEFVRTLLIDNYDSYTYNIFQELSVVNGVPPVVVRNDELTWEHVRRLLYEERAFDNVVISPGPGSPACPSDIGICLQLLLECSDIPILGVCLGHQALGYVHGARVVHASEPIHGRLSEIKHDGSRLFHGIPSGPNSGFKVVRYHSLVVDADSLPSELVPIAWTSSSSTHSFLEMKNYKVIPNGYAGRLEPPSSFPKTSLKLCNGTSHSLSHLESMQRGQVLMGMMHSSRPHFGLQFHPESIATSHGRRIFHNFREYTENYWWTVRSTYSHKTDAIFHEFLSEVASVLGLFISVEDPPTHYLKVLGRIWKLLYGIRANCPNKTHGSLCSHDPRLKAREAVSSPYKLQPDELRLMEHVGENPTSEVASMFGLFIILEDPPSLKVPGADQLFRPPMRRADDHGRDVQDFEHTSLKSQILCNGNGKHFLKMPEILNLSKLGICLKPVRLKWRKLGQLAAEIGGAKNIFQKLFGSLEAENTFWLDSSSLEKERARFSIMGGKCGPLWRQITFRLPDGSDSGCKGGGYLSIEDAQGDTRRMFLENGFFDYLNKEIQSFCYDEKDYEGLPFEFYGGYIGYIGYNLKVECGAFNRHKSRTPDACLFFADNFLVIDHTYDDIYIMSLQDATTSCSLWLDDTEEKLHSLKPSVGRKIQPATSFPIQTGFVGQKSREEYISDVQKCLKYIKDGESYELCLTTQLRQSVQGIDSMGLYFLLRDKNPAPYAAWMNFSNEQLCICCSSPERFLRLDREGMLEAKPIKGTVARGATNEEDELLKLQLQYSEKDQAENLMIVDLLRNDLGRVCEPGSVHVPTLMDVESYATVHTMVSTIRGRKRANATAVDCIRAAFPGGSMTGAPKLRSMELLDSLETCSRGIYSGSIGFFSYNQTFDLNIVIRTIVIHEGEASIGAGGAIVALSKPEDEYEEMLLKTRAPAKAVQESMLFNQNQSPTLESASTL